METISINFSTAVVALIVAFLAFLAVRRIVRRGLCDSGGTCDKCANGSGGCSSCSAVDKMVADMQRTVQKTGQRL